MHDEGHPNRVAFVLSERTFAMPFYNKSPFRGPIRLLYAGVVEYLFGSWAQDKSPAQFYVTATALAANVATLGVTIYGGDPPAVGSLVSVQGTQTSGGQFNVVNVALSAVNLVNGAGTVSFPLVGANQATTPDAGIAVVPQPIQTEAIAAGASIPVAMSNNSYGGDLNNTVTAQAVFGSLPTAVTVQLQGSMFENDADYVTLGTIATVAGSAVTANGLTVTGNWLFFRGLVSGITGAGTMAVQIEA